MARKRRPFEVFSMSFLDCMSCGFGAVILFFMIINAQVRETTEQPSELMSETRKLEVEILEGRKNLVLARNTLEDLEEEKDTAEGQIAQIIALIEQLRAELAEYEETLRAHDLRFSDELKFITEAEHIHSTSDRFAEDFEELRLRLGIDSFTC